QIWQVTIVAAITVGIVRLFCRTRPRLAYLLGIVVLLKCWVPPTWRSPVGIFCWPDQEAALPAKAGKSLPRAKSTERPLKIAVTNRVPHLVGETADMETADRRYDEVLQESPAVDLSVVLGSVWLAGALGLAVFALLQDWRWRRRLKTLTPAHDARLDS